MQSKAVGGLTIGGAVGALGLVIGPVSGGSMNPVRTLGPALVLGRYDSVWVYLVAPVSGMLLGALCNRLVRSSDAILAFLCGGDAAAALRARRANAPRAVGAVVASQQQ
jgi:aquaporin NIP